MDRREALAALLSLPPTTRVSRLAAKPGAVIVFEVPGSLDAETAARLTEIAETHFPEFRFLVVSDGVTVKVLTEGGA